VGRQKQKSEYWRERNLREADLGDIVESLAIVRKRKKYARDLLRWCEEVFKSSCGLKPYGIAQRDSIAITERAILHGGRVVIADPRGYGKTTRSIVAALWAVCYNHRRFVVIYSASQKQSANVLAAIRAELENNDVLGALFPRICMPIAALGGKHQTARSQTQNGSPTNIQLLADKIVFATISECEQSGNILMSRPATNARGLIHTSPSGYILRPDLVILDDIATDDMAASPERSAKMVRRIVQSILQTGSHAKPIACIANCTVISRDDVAETFLSLRGWQGVRHAMLLKPADNEMMWLQEYAALRTTYDRSVPGADREAQAHATAYYREHKDVMDAGAIVSWDECYHYETGEEISAIQHAYNLLIDYGPEVFAAEYQNQPLQLTRDCVVQPSAQAIAAQQTAMLHRICRKDQHLISVGIDVQERALYYSVLASTDDLTIQVVDYGIFPEQPGGYQPYAALALALQEYYHSSEDQQAIARGLHELIEHIMQQRYDDSDQEPEICLVDKGYLPETIEAVLKSSSFRRKLWPAKGIGITAREQPLHEKALRPGERAGYGWMQIVNRSRFQRYMLLDVNLLKATLHDGLRHDPGSPGSVSLWVAPPHIHRPFAEHVASEWGYATEGRGRKLIEYKHKPTKPDNHWLDASVLALAGLLILGAKRPGMLSGPARKKQVFNAFPKEPSQWIQNIS